MLIDTLAVDENKVKVHKAKSIINHFLCDALPSFVAIPLKKDKMFKLYH